MPLCNQDVGQIGFQSSRIEKGRATDTGCVVGGEGKLDDTLRRQRGGFRQGLLCGLGFNPAESGFEA